MRNHFLRAGRVANLPSDSGGIDNTDSDLLLHIDPSNSSSYSGSGSTVTDLSTSSNDGTIESNVNFDSTEGGGSFEFDSSSSEIQFTPITIDHTAATVELWLKNSQTSNNTVFAIANTTSNSYSSRVMSVHVPYSGTVYFDGGTGDGVSRVSKTDPTDILTKWYHWTFVLSTTEQKIYLNGVEWDSGSGSSYGVGTDGDAAHTTINHGDGFRGHVGAVRVWKKAFSASDALANFNLDRVQYGYAPAPTPTLSSSIPADGATDFGTDGNIQLTFNTAVDAESGNIYIKKVSDNSTVETISVTGSQVSGSGTTTITINPSSDLTDGTAYYINIDATAFDNVDGISYAGISDSTTLNFTAVTPTMATSGLIVHLDAEDSNSYGGSGTTWSDLTSNNKDFTIYGSPTFNTSTPKNFEMDGSNDYMLRANESFSFDGATIEIWINKTSSSSMSGIFSFPGATYFNLFWFGSGTKFRLEARDTGSTYRQLFSGAKSYGNWYQLVGVIDNSNGLYMYVNGSLETSRTANVGDISDFTSQMIVGYSTASYRPYMKVAIVRIYDRPLTSTEVSNNYNINKSRFGLS